MAQPDKPTRETPVDIPQSQTFAQSALAKAQEAADHFAGRDAPPDDAIERWGRRIGRALSLLAVIALAIYLFITYILR